MGRVLFAILLVLPLGFLVTCSGKDKPATPAIGQTPPARTPDATYVVRGEITMLPVAGDNRAELKVHHEAIDNFKDSDGKVVGMNAMTMEFPPAKGVDLSNLKKGDKVQLTFSVWWSDTPPWLAVKIVKLPAETKLVFGKANPAAPAPPPAPSPVPK